MTGSATIADVLRNVASASGLAARHIVGPLRTADISFVRHAFYYLAYHETGQGYAMIGRILGARDQSTIRTGVRKGEYLYATNSEFKALVDRARSVNAGDDDVIAMIARRETLEMAA